MAVDPYAAPKSHVADVRTIDAEGNFVMAGRSVAAGNGWTWITDAWDLVKTQKGAWIGLIVVFVVILFAMNFLPIVGPLLLMLLMPVFYGGVMRGCDVVRNGGTIQLSHLFAGFREKTSRLIGVGAVSLAVFAALFVIAMIVFGAQAARTMLGVQPTPEQMQAMGMSFLLVPLLFVALSVPLYMAIWFASPLIVLNDLSVGEALKASFAACLKNVVPFLLFGIAFFGLAIVASIPVLLGWLLLGPVLLASIYTGYRDIFYES
jgi:uncharacterized membrane protein